MKKNKYMYRMAIMPGDNTIGNEPTIKVDSFCEYWIDCDGYEDSCERLRRMSNRTRIPDNMINLDRKG